MLQGIQQLFQGDLDTLNPKMAIVLLNQLLFLRHCQKTVFFDISTILKILIQLR